MAKALLESTSDLAKHTAASRTNMKATLADNTRDAIERGCRVALAALVDRTCDDFARESGQAPALFLTGGAADEVRPYLRSVPEHVPDLVLQGLAILAREP
jgi:type III pantothenate kinase